jgi:predicted dehydrogenase
LSERALKQTWPSPKKKFPIVVIGAGGIVRHAHLPAYARAGFEVRGLFDVRREVARKTARDFGIERVYGSLEDAFGEEGVVFDLAVPAEAIVPVLKRAPAGIAILIQKPMGRDLAEARRIQKIVAQKKLVAAIHFQLRFAPNMLALRDLLTRGTLGDVRDVEVRVVTHTPWSNWSFLAGIPRLEILYHSIHYLDLLRSLFGEPEGVRAATFGDPSFPGYADTRSSILLDYGPGARVSIHTNHAHDYGASKQMSEIKIEGTRGAAVARMGVNLDYPKGEPDTLEHVVRGGRWNITRVKGSWFPDAFSGPMKNLQRSIRGEDRELFTRTEDALRTMALVEACYRSSALDPTRLPRTENERRTR